MLCCQSVGFLIGVVVGLAMAASVVAAIRLLRPPRVVSDEVRGLQTALHAANGMLPDLRRGLSEDSARKVTGHLLTLTQASAVALGDKRRVLAFEGLGHDHHHAGDELIKITAPAREDRLHVESRLACEHPDCPLGAVIAAPLLVAGELVGSFVALYARGHRITPNDTRTAAEAASLVSAQLELNAMDEQAERLARAELRALRAQISPHFIYNALAAIAGYIHSNPDEARDLLTEFAEFTRYAFRSQRPYVTLADELGYVEKYLRLERARFGERLQVRLQVEPEVLPVVVRCSRCSRWWRTRCATGSSGAASAASRSSVATSITTWSCGSQTTVSAWTRSGLRRCWRVRAAGSASPTCRRGCRRSSAPDTAWSCAASPVTARPSR